MNDSLPECQIIALSSKATLDVVAAVEDRLAEQCEHNV
jgi:hypothetical protein